MRLPPPVVVENTVEQIVGGPRDGWWKWTIGFEGNYIDPGTLGFTPTPNFPIGMMLLGFPDDYDNDTHATITYPIGVESAYRPWKPGGIGLDNNLFGSTILWRTETIVDGGDTDSDPHDVTQRDGFGMLPFTLRAAGYDEPPTLNWDVSSVKPGAISHIGDVLYFPPDAFPAVPPFPAPPMPNGWFMAARQYTMDANTASWSHIVLVGAHLRAGTGASEIEYADFIGGPLVNDPSVSIGPRDKTKLFNTLGVWQGNSLGGLTEIGSSGNSSVDGGVTFDAVEGQTYRIQVGTGLPGTNGSAVLTWE